MQETKKKKYENFKIKIIYNILHNWIRCKLILQLIPKYYVIIKNRVSELNDNFREPNILKTHFLDGEPKRPRTHFLDGEGGQNVLERIFLTGGTKICSRTHF